MNANDEVSICPSCQRPLPPGEQTQLVWCPACGCDLQVADEVTVSNVSPRIRIGWFVFWLALLSPPLMVMGLRGLTPIRDESMLSVTVVLSSVSGLACGAWLAWRVTKRVVLRVLLFLVFTFCLYWLNFFLCFLGCMVVREGKVL